MVKKVKIKLKKKPVKPVRKEKVMVKYHIDDGATMSGLMEWAKGLNKDFSNIIFYSDIQHEYYGYTYAETYFYTEIPEPDEEYHERFDSYSKSLCKYYKWYEKNEVLIEEELKRRELEAEAKAKKETIKKEIRIGREKIRLEKELKKIQEKLKNW